MQQKSNVHIAFITDTIKFLVQGSTDFCLPTDRNISLGLDLMASLLEMSVGSKQRPLSNTVLLIMRMIFSQDKGFLTLLRREPDWSFLEALRFWACRRSVYEKSGD